MDKSLESGATTIDNGEDNVDTRFGEKSGTARDMEDMERLGKKQLFKRNFGFISIFSFALILMGTWETLLGTVAFGLANGGPSGLIYTYIVVAMFFILVYACMAEMASMAPTTGGQYHWVSEFAPPKYQRQLSYLIGWLSVLGWQAGNTIGAFLAGTQIQGLVILNYPDYVYHRYHGTLMAMAITFSVLLFNIFLARHLPVVEAVIGFGHFAGAIIIIAVLWALAPRTPSNMVWNSFQDGGGWGSTGLASLVGMITNVGGFIGGDSPAHMSEELKDASKNLPRAIFLTTIFNGALGFIMLVTFCYTFGDLTAALNSPTGYPIIEVFYQATESTASATALTCILIIMSIANNLTNMAGASRQLFAFARDGGVPFQTWMSSVPPSYKVPVNSLIATTIFACVLHCINIGSSIAFNVIISIGTVALMTSYFVCIACVAYRRLRGLPLQLSPEFNLGKWGIAINMASLAFLLLALVMAFFPEESNPSPAEMNWACVVYGGVLGVAGVYYVGWARKSYVGPVAYVKRRVAGEEEED